MKTGSKLSLLAGLAAFGAMDAMDVSGIEGRRHEVRSGISERKIPLTPKQRRNRRKTKAQGKARKINR